MNFISEEKNFKSLDTVESLLKTWRTRYPSAKVDDIIVWDNVVTNRAQLLEKLNERYAAFWNNRDSDAMDVDASKRPISLSALKSLLIDERAETYREMATGARKQLNFFVADLYLKLCLKAKAKQKQFLFSFFQSLVKLYCIKAKHAPNVLDNVDKFVKALKFIEGKNVRRSVFYIQVFPEIFFWLAKKISRGKLEYKKQS